MIDCYFHLASVYRRTSDAHLSAGRIILRLPREFWITRTERLKHNFRLWEIPENIRGLCLRNGYNFQDLPLSFAELRGLTNGVSL